MELYRKTDVFVLPSVGENEAFGMVLLEAMRAGCPVVTTDIPTGVNFVNQDGVTGLVVPSKTSIALAEAINRILHDSELRQRFSLAARQRVSEVFSFDQMMERAVKIYHSALKQAK